MTNYGGTAYTEEHGTRPCTRRLSRRRGPSQEDIIFFFLFAQHSPHTEAPKAKGGRPSEPLYIPPRAVPAAVSGLTPPAAPAARGQTGRLPLKATQVDEECFPTACCTCNTTKTSAGWC
jgi:hypothetical protein